MTAENDGPHKAENDWGPSINDIWDVYVHQFDLHQQQQVLTIKHNTSSDVLYVWKLTDFFLRKFSAVSMLALCWKTPCPLCLFYEEKLQHQLNIHLNSSVFWLFRNPILGSLILEAQ